MNDAPKSDEEFTAVILIRRKVQGQILDWATALEMNAQSATDPAKHVAKEMREWLRSL